MLIGWALTPSPLDISSQNYILHSVVFLTREECSQNAVQNRADGIERCIVSEVIKAKEELAKAIDCPLAKLAHEEQSQQFYSLKLKPGGFLDAQHKAYWQILCFLYTCIS